MNKKEHNEESEPQLKIDGAETSDMKKRGFSVPENYFENLTPRIMESVRSSSEVKTQTSINWRRFLIPTIGIAAVLLTGWFFLRPNNTSTVDFDGVLATLSVEELTEYADLQPSELFEYELVDYEQIAIAGNDLTDEEIIEYLTTEDEIEWSTIMNEIDI